MEKILAPADKVLSEIGRFVLLRPIVSGVLLLTAIIVTLLSNGAFMLSSASEHSAGQPIAIPHLHSLATPLIVGNEVTTLLSQAALANHTNAPEPAANPAPAVNTFTSANPGENVTQTAVIEDTLSPASPQSQIATQPPSQTAVPATNNATATQTKIPANARWQAFRVHSGDNLARIFKKYKVSAKDATTIASLPFAKTLRQLKPGREMLLIIDDKQKLQKLTYAAGNQDELTLVRTESGFQLEKIQPPVLASVEPDTATSVSNPTADLSVSTSTAITANDASLSYVSGEVRKSLAADARKAGLSSNQANQLVQIFNGQKVQRGDQFSVLLEDAAAPTGKKPNNNNILIVQLTHADKLLQLIRFTDPKGNTNYYTPKGESLSAGILRAPIQYKRISSYFSNSRFHPILHFFRPHLGVDYAAPSGTPIKAAGNGIIAEIERAGGYGKSILIKHDAKYSTLYAHMSNFAGNLHVGSVVQQGQVIGYVGSTGLATGPHLHYEIHVNNIAMNPLTVDLPSAMVPKPYLNQFFAQAKVLVAQLKSNQSMRLADKGDTVRNAAG